MYNVPNPVHSDSKPQPDFESLSDYTVWSGILMIDMKHNLFNQMLAHQSINLDSL